MFVGEGRVARRQFLYSPNNDDEFFTTKQHTQVLHRHTHTQTSSYTHTQKSTYTDTQKRHTQINDFSTHNVSWKKTYSTKNRSTQKIFLILFLL